MSHYAKLLFCIFLKFVCCFTAIGQNASKQNISDSLGAIAKQNSVKQLKMLKSLWEKKEIKKFWLDSASLHRSSLELNKVVDRRLGNINTNIISDFIGPMKFSINTMLGISDSTNILNGLKDAQNTLSNGGNFNIVTELPLLKLGDYSNNIFIMSKVNYGISLPNSVISSNLDKLAAFIGGGLTTGFSLVLNNKKIGLDGNFMLGAYFSSKSYDGVVYTIQQENIKSEGRYSGRYSGNLAISILPLDLSLGIDWPENIISFENRKKVILNQKIPPSISFKKFIYLRNLEK